jgi:hypothetical protein
MPSMTNVKKTNRTLNGSQEIRDVQQEYEMLLEQGYALSMPPTKGKNYLKNGNSKFQIFFLFNISLFLTFSSCDKNKHS